jgi:hypothetical protein
MKGGEDSDDSEGEYANYEIVPRDELGSDEEDALDDGKLFKWDLS